MFGSINVLAGILLAYLLKGPILSVLVFLFTRFIKSLCPLELIFIVKPQGQHVLLGEIRQGIYILCDFFAY